MKLVYDIGGFDGSDTARYLSLGYRVLCIEAEPGQAEGIRRRCPAATVLNVAVGEREGAMPFYVQKAGELNSFEKRPGTTEIQVPVRTLASILAEYGVPYFLKVDIEGADRHAILPLTREKAPQYVSFEAGKKDLDLILHLHAIGYTRFNIIRQDTQTVVSLPAPGSFLHLKWSARQVARLGLRRLKWLHALARRAKDAGAPSELTSGLTPMERKDGWRDIETMLRDWSQLVASGMIDSAWFDVHASVA